MRIAWSIVNLTLGMHTARFVTIHETNYQHFPKRIVLKTARQSASLVQIHQIADRLKFANLYFLTHQKPEVAESHIGHSELRH